MGSIVHLLIMILIIGGSSVSIARMSYGDRLAGDLKTLAPLVAYTGLAAIVDIIAFSIATAGINLYQGAPFAANLLDLSRHVYLAWCVIALIFLVSAAFIIPAKVSEHFFEKMAFILRVIVLTNVSCLVLIATFGGESIMNVPWASPLDGIDPYILFIETMMIFACGYLYGLLKGTYQLGNRRRRSPGQVR